MLSIRTQDRMALVLYKGVIEIESRTMCFETEAYEYEIVYQGLQHTEISLGTYETNERALEVLDEIELYSLGKVLIPTSSYEIRNDLAIGSNPYVEMKGEKIEVLPQVYQMPTT